MKVIDELPEGLLSNLGERGRRFSGGQRQRLALARAFYHKRELIVLDEATSSLDSETEKEVVKEIRSLKGKVTLIVIAHRLSTVKDCDYIYKLENGKMVDQGAPNNILKKANVQ